jgi:hypothetical protein
VKSWHEIFLDRLFIILWYGRADLFLCAPCFPFCVPTIRPWIPPTCQHASGDDHSLAMYLSLVLTNLFEGLHQVFYICCARTSNSLISETQCYTSLNVLQVFFFFHLDNDIIFAVSIVYTLWTGCIRYWHSTIYLSTYSTL